MAQTLRHAVAAGELPPAAAELPDRVTLRNSPHGRCDFASNLALRLAPTTGHPALRIAGILRSRLVREAGIARVEVAGPGFLNITLRESAHAALVRQLLTPARSQAQHGPLPEDPVRDAIRWAAVTGGPLSYERRDRQSLFRVQYAHARCHGLLVAARDLGFAPEVGHHAAGAEVALLALLSDFERISATCLERAGGTHAPTARVTAREAPASVTALATDLRPLAPLARHLRAVADAFTDFQHAPHQPILPLGDEKPKAAHRSRLALAKATGTVLAGGLTQLGISAPNYL